LFEAGQGVEPARLSGTAVMDASSINALVAVRAMRLDKEGVD
jgi:hypothetical protein